MNLEVKSEEFLCGGVASLVNISITYPISKLIFRQQIHGFRIRTAVRQLRNEGPMLLYRGVLPPLLQKTASISFMFGFFDLFNSHLSSIITYSDIQRHLCAGLLSGSAEAILTTPFERIQTLLQDRAHHQKYQNTAHAFYMLRTNGVAEYFTGLTPILLRNSLGTALYFAFRSHLATLFESAGSRVRSLVNSSLHRRPSDVPFLNVPSAAVPPNVPTDPSLAFNERGSREHSLFSNQSPQLQIKQQQQQQQQHSRFVNFVSGAVIGALCSTLVYPLNVIKAHMQSRVGVPAAGNFRRTFAELSERGARKSYIWQPFYRGASLNCSRAVISWGIINMVYEQAKSLVRSST